MCNIAASREFNTPSYLQVGRLRLFVSRIRSSDRVYQVPAIILKAETDRPLILLPHPTKNTFAIPRVATTNYTHPEVQIRHKDQTGSRSCAAPRTFVAHFARSIAVECGVTANREVTFLLPNLSDNSPYTLLLLNSNTTAPIDKSGLKGLKPNTHATYTAKKRGSFVEFFLTWPP